MEEKLEAPGQSKKPIETLNREELIQKYKGLLGIAKKAKQAKDEFAEDNRKLKEALAHCETQRDADNKKMAITNELLEQYTKQKLQLTTEFSELQRKSKADDEALTQLRIENESLQRQFERVNKDNEALLKDIDRMEDKLKQVNLLGMEQKKHLGLLELEVKKLKYTESLNSALQSTVSVTEAENKSLKEQRNCIKQAMEELGFKYIREKHENMEQRNKFNALKERFVEVHRKLKKLKECKQVLLETQHEYAEAISKWQNEIIKASKLLCTQINALKSDNEQMQRQIQLYESQACIAKCEHTQSTGFDVHAIEVKLQGLQGLCESVRNALLEKDRHLAEMQQQNLLLQIQIAAENNGEKEVLVPSNNIMSERLESEVNRLTQELSDLKMKFDSHESQLNAAELSNYVLQSEHSELLQRLEAVIMERDSLKEECNKIEELNLDKKRLREEVEHLMVKMQETKKVHEDLQQIRDVLKALEEEKISLLAQLRQQENDPQQQQCSKQSIKTIEDKYIELQERFSQKEREHADLLSEMRELNEALKARGDVISRQQEKHQDLIIELRKTNAKLKQIDETMMQKDIEIAQKENQLREISGVIEGTHQKVRDLEEASARSEKQLRDLNEELQVLRNNSDAQSEVLSTTTISRTEELGQMQEVDESFEDKYNKLRGFAVKLKKKLQEQTAQLAEMEQQQSRHIDMVMEVEILRKQLADMQQVQEEKQQLVESLKSENHKLQSSCKQANVLKLEIEAAEKTLNEATSKLAAKTGEVQALSELLSNKEHTIAQLRKEISIVESAKLAETAHAKELKEQVDLLQEQIKDAVHGKQLGVEANKQLANVQERLNQELAGLRLEMSKCASESSAAILASQHEKQVIERQLQYSEAKLSETLRQMRAVEQTLNDLGAEHLEYKQKAQAVLRKQQSSDTMRERELADELAQLRAEEEDHRKTVVAKSNKIAELEQHASDLYVDNENLQRHVQELSAFVEDLRQQNNRLAQEQQTQLQAHHEALRAQRKQLDMVQECNKQQIIDLEIKYQTQVEQLRTEQIEKQRPSSVIGADTTTTSKSLISNTANKNQIIAERLILAEREDAEGSEEFAVASTTNSNHQALRKISTSSQRSQHDFMPLDELLNTPLHAFQTDIVTTVSGSILGRKDSVMLELNDDSRCAGSLHVQLQETRKLLEKAESRVRHLTALLAENEQDLAKFTQMNDMLKEELRRQERAVEREQHMHNAEYLKNILLKFLTLGSGDERVHLVPVLNTILKLNRNETEVLNRVAKGQKLPTDSQIRGWSSFLPLFGGGSGNSN